LTVCGESLELTFDLSRVAFGRILEAELSDPLWLVLETAERVSDRLRVRCRPDVARGMLAWFESHAREWPSSGASDARVLACVGAAQTIKAALQRRGLKALED
jgi:hypothetical protein